MNSLETAYLLRELGISCIPIGKQKRPYFPWEIYQKRLPTKPELYSWFSKGGNIAVIGGEVSGNLTIIDFDDLADEIFTKWTEQPRTHRLVGILPFVQTGKGIHVYFRSDLKIPNRKLARKEVDGKILNLIETRGEGGYAICPPSIHPSGKQYQFIGDLGFKDVPLLSDDEARGLIETAEQFNEIARPQRKRIVFSSNDKISDSAMRRYALGALKGIASDLAAVSQGDRNNRLYASAFRLGRYAGARLLRASEIEGEVRTACQQNGLIRDDGEHSFRATLASGISDGSAVPVTKMEMEEILSDDAWVVEFFGQKEPLHESNGNGEGHWIIDAARKLMTEV